MFRVSARIRVRRIQIDNGIHLYVFKRRYTVP